ncbi:MAG: CRISPR-associated endonuclease Cas1 [Puniceicoccaceae bacterium]|nr:CRISPR-associated endonuclease Cas1 [Puniceicoccaceae bacterium]
MPTVYLTTYGIKVILRGERLEITTPPEVTKDKEHPLPARRWIPLHDVEHVVLDSSVHLSPHCMNGLLQRGIPVLLLSNRHFPSGTAQPINRSVRILAQQLDCCRDPDKTLPVAISLVEAKILNMRRTIQRLSANRKQPPVAAPWLKSMANQARACPTIDSLRGIEGACSGRYFETIGSFFPPELPFERRSRQPPLNPPNSLLSFVYTLLTNEITLHLRACGLEPGWGFLHEAEDGRPALALDLIEPFRAPVADALTLDLLNHKRLKARDFEYTDGGCYLRRESRRRVFAAYEDRMEREFQYEKAGHRTTLRNCIKQLCLDCKAYFREGRLPQAFIMN